MPLVDAVFSCFLILESAQKHSKTTVEGQQATAAQQAGKVSEQASDVPIKAGSGGKSQTAAKRKGSAA